VHRRLCLTPMDIPRTLALMQSPRLHRLLAARGGKVNLEWGPPTVRLASVTAPLGWDWNCPTAHLATAPLGWDWNCPTAHLATGAGMPHVTCDWCQDGHEVCLAVDSGHHDLRYLHPGFPRERQTPMQLRCALLVQQDTLQSRASTACCRSLQNALSASGAHDQHPRRRSALEPAKPQK
jgi:hypothetical protein